MSENVFFEVRNLKLSYRTIRKQGFSFVNRLAAGRKSRKSFEPRDLVAVNNVSFSIEKPGRALAIVGESGCGKTSLALAILRQLPNNVSEFSGDIFLEGENIRIMPSAEFRKRISWKKISWVPQNHASMWNPVLKIGNEIQGTLEFHKVRNARGEMVRLLEAVGLNEGHASHYPHQLSGGQLQRACIARALLLRPALVILDEPTSSLDVSLEGEIINLLNELKEKFSLSYIFITHNIARASSFADKFAVFYGGRIVEMAPTQKILSSPRHPYTRALLGCVPTIHPSSSAGRGPVPSIPGEPPDLRVVRDVCPFRVRPAVRCSQCERAEVPPPLREVEPGHFVACHGV